MEADDSGIASAFATSVVSCFGLAPLLGFSSQQPRELELDSNNTNNHPNIRTASSVAATINQGEWLTDLVAQLWPLIRMVANQKIREKVEPRLAALPAPLNTLHFVQLDVGRVPIRLDNIIVHESTSTTGTGSADSVQFDLDVVWDGACDIQLKASYIGTLGVQSVKLLGRLSVLLQPLKADLPIVQAVQVAFINPPMIHLEFSGVAHAVADSLDVVRTKIHDILQKILQQQMVLPNRRLVKLDPTISLLSDNVLKAPVGVARVTIQQGSGFVVEERNVFQKADIPDCYVVATLGNTKRQSATIKDDLKPVWNETMDYVLSDFDQIVHLEVWDEDGGPLDPDDFLGAADVTVGQVLLQGGQITRTLLGEGGKPTTASLSMGVQCLNWTTDLDSLSNTTSLEGRATNNEIVGLLTILVTQAFGLPFEKQDVKASIKVTYADQEFMTKVVTDYPGLDSLNPLFDSVFHVPLTADLVTCNGRILNIEFSLLNNKQNCLGTLSVGHDDIASSPECTLTEKRQVGTMGAAIEYRLVLRGVQPASKALVPFDGSMVPSSSRGMLSPNGSVTPVQITVVKAHGFKSQRFRRFLRRRQDIADPYLVIKYGSDPHPWRTKTKTDSLTPTWNESHTYFMKSHGQTIRIQVYDDNEGRKKKREKDDLLGMARVTVGKVLLAGGTLEVEMELEGQSTGIFVTIVCKLQEVAATATSSAVSTHES
eukprot:scaffold5520_cov167-Amphora_coffeaeformis.AAC.6